MKTEKLNDIRKELQHQSSAQLAQICLRMARYKKENKELLAYLLFEADDELAFADTFKAEMGLQFSQIPHQQSAAIKHLRKTLRLVTKYIRFTGSKQVEVELLLAFAKYYLEYVHFRNASRALVLLYLKQLEKIKKAIVKLHEDLQFDYGQEFVDLVEQTSQKMPHFDKDAYQL